MIVKLTYLVVVLSLLTSVLRIDRHRCLTASYSPDPGQSDEDEVEIW